MDQLVNIRSQLIIATHSPILLAYPGAEIYQINHGDLVLTRHEETEHYQITKAFLNNPEKMLKELMEAADY